MAPSDQTPFTVTYRKSGTKPPVFVAGSFTEHPWQPQQMEAIEDGSGEYLFSKQLQVTPGRAYQIKFKIGHGDWWVYDEDKPVGMHQGFIFCRTLAKQTVSPLLRSSLTSD